MNGKSFIREFKTDVTWDGSTSKRVFQHTVSFSNGGIMKDDANCFFGSPPEYFNYWVEGNTILANNIMKPEQGTRREYTIVDEETISNSQGALLKLKK